MVGGPKGGNAPGIGLSKTTPASTLAPCLNRKATKPSTEDEAPPVISQNHYRHIHEQRDFTMENLSMAGETELMDYEEEHVRYEEEWQLDDEI